MRPIRFVPAWAALTILAFSSALAEDWSPLDRTPVRDRRASSGGGSQWLSKTTGKPARLKGLPDEMGNKPSYFSATINARKTWLVIGSPPADSRGRISPKLVVDSNQNGDLSDETIVTGRKRREGGLIFGRTVDSYGPVTFKPADDVSAPGVDLTIQYLGSDGLAVSPAYDRSGDIKIDGQDYHVVLYDANADGRFDGYYVPPKEQTEEEAAGNAWSVLSQFDEISIVAKDAKPPSADGAVYRFWDTPPLTRTMRLKDTYYRVEVKPDGSAIRLTKADLPMGTLDVACADACLTLFSECGIQELQGSDGKWSLPAGRYVCWWLSLRQVGEGDVVWTLQGSGDMGKLREIVIQPGKTLAVRMGPPLQVRTEARRVSGFLGRNHYISMALIGQAGEGYSHGAYKGRWRLPAPRLKILDEKDQVLANGQFEYG